MKNDATPRSPHIIITSGKPVEAVNPGWSMTEGRLREPLILVPPGTIICLDVQGDPINVKKKLHLNGIGVYTNLGWGTTIVI